MSLHPIKSRRKNRKTYSQLRAREEWKPWKGWNWDSTKKKGFDLFGRKAFAFLLIGLAVTIGFGAMYADPNNGLFHSYEKTTNPCIPTAIEIQWSLPCGDPQQGIWGDNQFPNSGAEFQTQNSQAVSCTSGPATHCFKLASNSSSSAIALTKAPIDLSTISSHELLLTWAYCFNTSPSGSGTPRWGVFLTTNGTLPRGGYDPRSDKSVAFVNEILAIPENAGAVSDFTWTQKDPASTIASGDVSVGAQGIGTLFLTVSPNNLSTSTCGASVSNGITVTLNYTGASPSTAGVNSVVQTTPFGGGTTTSTQTLTPWFNTAPNYYVGLFKLICTSCADTFVHDITFSRVDPPPSVPTPISPNLDTGGWWGSLIKALVPIGVYILNGILAFVGFIVPALQSALAFLQTVYVATFNILGNLLGFGNVGTYLQTVIGDVVAFFTNPTYGVPAIFANVGAVFSRFFDVNNVYFQWVPTALSIAVNIATLAINSVGFVLTIIQFAFKLVAGVYLIVLLTLFLVYTGDDSLGGILGFLETTQWLILGPLGWLAKILNFALDIVTHLIGLIPKPLIQMIAHAFPRIPIVETNARFVNPSFDLAAIRSGNMLAVWAWFVDFTFLAWYNGITPALPGSLGNLLPGMPATTFTALRGFLPVLEIFLIIISALAFIIWPMNKMLSVFALDLDVLDFEMSPGRKISSTGLGGIRLKGAKKRFGAGLEKKVNKKKMERIERETRKVVSVEEERKIKEQTEKLKEESRQLEKLAERNK